ncbi:MAG: hypothetical protein ACPL5I_01465 [Thermodesulfobacteriota bacterium]
MAKKNSKFLDTNALFPQMEWQLVTEEKLKLPEGIGEGYGVILFYRGYW